MLVILCKTTKQEPKQKREREYDQLVRSVILVRAMEQNVHYGSEGPLRAAFWKNSSAKYMLKPAHHFLASFSIQN